MGDGAITAHHRDLEEEDTGFSFVGCKIGGTPGTTTSLGRPWGDYARVIFSYCYINDMIIPQGWTDWDESTTKYISINAHSNPYYMNLIYYIILELLY